MSSNVVPRISSIDILRAITMLLMIFVNDLWSVKDVPLWLEHTAANDDGMGLADTVFPAFLVIVGMSVPFAIANRRARGEKNRELIIHIILRSIALIVMGVFLVNGETLDARGTGLPGWTWYPLCCFAFILIWNYYPKQVNKKVVTALKLTGVAILLVLAWMYRGGDDGAGRFTTSWWGILGLIGWAYLVSSVAFVCLGKSIPLVITFWMFCLILNIAVHADLLKGPDPVMRLLAPFGEGAMPAFVSAGMLGSMVLIKYQKAAQPFRVIGVLCVIALILGILGFAVRPLDGISKIKATPSWVLICTAITFLFFAFVYWLTDIHKKEHWFDIIKPAGTNTLTCYLLPYFAYGLMNAFSVSYPAAISYGIVGLIKCLVFALLIVLIGGWFGRRGVRVKL